MASACVINVGDRFESFIKLSEAVKAYEANVGASFYIRSSRTLKNKPSVPISEAQMEELRYHDVYYSCVLGGRSARPTAASALDARLMNSATFKGCNARIKVKLSREMDSLEVCEFCDEHNHSRNSDQSAPLQSQYSLPGHHHLTGQGLGRGGGASRSHNLQDKIPDSVRRDTALLLSLNTSQNKIKQHIQQATGQKVSSKHLRQIQDESSRKFKEGIPMSTSRWASPVSLPSPLFPTMMGARSGPAEQISQSQLRGPLATAAAEKWPAVVPRRDLIFQEADRLQGLQAEQRLHVEQRLQAERVAEQLHQQSRLQALADAYPHSRNSGNEYRMSGGHRYPHEQPRDVFPHRGNSRGGTPSGNGLHMTGIESSLMHAHPGPSSDGAQMKINVAPQVTNLRPSQGLRGAGRMGAIGVSRGNSVPRGSDLSHILDSYTNRNASPITSSASAPVQQNGGSLESASHLRAKGRHVDSLAMNGSATEAGSSSTFATPGAVGIAEAGARRRSRKRESGGERSQLAQASELCNTIAAHLCETEDPEQFRDRMNVLQTLSVMWERDNMAAERGNRYDTRNEISFEANEDLKRFSGVLESGTTDSITNGGGEHTDDEDRGEPPCLEIDTDVNPSSGPSSGSSFNKQNGSHSSTSCAEDNPLALSTNSQPEEASQGNHSRSSAGDQSNVLYETVPAADLSPDVGLSGLSPPANSSSATTSAANHHSSYENGQLGGGSQPDEYTRSELVQSPASLLRAVSESSAPFVQSGRAVFPTPMDESDATSDVGPVRAMTSLKRKADFEDLEDRRVAASLSADCKRSAVEITEPVDNSSPFRLSGASVKTEISTG